MPVEPPTTVPLGSEPPGGSRAAARPRAAPRPGHGKSNPNPNPNHYPYPYPKPNPIAKSFDRVSFPWSHSEGGFIVSNEPNDERLRDALGLQVRVWCRGFKGKGREYRKRRMTHDSERH